MFIEDGDVALRPVEKDDADFLRRNFMDPDIRDNFGRVPRPVNREQEEEWIEGLSEDESRVAFLVEYKGERAGEISLMDINYEYAKCRFGFFVDKEYHGNGVGTKALELVLEYAFNELNLHRVEGGYVDGNEASRRVQEKCGFREEGRERDGKYVNGEYKDVVILSVLEDEWRSE